MARGLRGLNVVGADLVEVSPPFDPSGGTAWLGISLMFEMLCVMAERVEQGASPSAHAPRPPGYLWPDERGKHDGGHDHYQRAGSDDGRGAATGRGGGACGRADPGGRAAAEVAALAGPGTQVIDADGRTLLPGFVESHLHLVLGGAELVHLQLGGVMGFDALKAAFAAYGAAQS